MRYLVACLIVCLGAGLSEAARKVQGNQPINVKLAFHYMAVMNFPEQIERVMGAGKSDASHPAAPAEQQPISIEIYANVLGLALLSPDAEGRLVVFGVSGQNYIVNYKPGTPGDDQVDVISSLRPEDKAVPFSAASFLRALKRGETIPGAYPETLPLPGQPDERLRILSATATGLTQGIGYVLRVENTQSEPLTIDSRIGTPSSPQPGVLALSTWTWLPGYTIVLVHTEEALLGPGGQTRILLILERRS